MAWSELDSASRTFCSLSLALARVCQSVPVRRLESLLELARSRSHPECVSDGAKIPIVPVEFSPPLNVVNRSPLHTEEVRKLVKGERRARTERTASARNEHPGYQQVDRWGPQDDSQVHAGGGFGTGVWPTVSTAEQARCVQAVFGRAAARRSVERASVAARIARAELCRRLHHSDGLVAAATQCGTSSGSTALRDGSGQAGASGLGASGYAGDGRARTEAARLHLHAGLQPQNGGGSGVGSKVGHAAAAARSRVPTDRRSAGRNSLRSHEDRVAGDGRARRDRLAPGVSGLRALLGLPAAAVPAASRATARESGSGREVRATELSVWFTRARTRQPERSECATARVDLGSSEPACARNNA